MLFLSDPPNSHHRNLHLREVILNALADFGDTDAETEMVHLLSSNDYPVRQRMYGDLIHLRARQQRDCLDLVRSGLVDRRYEVREEVLRTILQLPDDRYIPHVVPRLADASEKVIPLAFRFIREQKCTDPTLLAPLVAFIRNSGMSIESRTLAIDCLKYEHDVPEVVEALMETLALPDDDAFPLRKLAASALAHVRSRARLLPRLQANLRSTDPTVRSNALWAIAGFGLPEAVPILAPFLDDPDPGIQDAAVFGLARAGASEYRPKLRAMLNHLTA